MLAAKMFMEADKIYRNGSSDIDWINSILLSGAVVGIAAPLVEEYGGKSTHRGIAELTNHIAGSKKYHVGLFRAVYNSLKHAGDKRNDLPASQDLTLEVDLKDEAANMLDAAKEDLSGIGLTPDQLEELGDEFETILHDLQSYI